VGTSRPTNVEQPETVTWVQTISYCHLSETFCGHNSVSQFSGRWWPLIYFKHVSGYCCLEAHCCNSRPILFPLNVSRFSMRRWMRAEIPTVAPWLATPLVSTSDTRLLRWHSTCSSTLDSRWSVLAGLELTAVEETVASRAVTARKGDGITTMNLFFVVREMAPRKMYSVAYSNLLIY